MKNFTFLKKLVKKAGDIKTKTQRKLVTVSAVLTTISAGMTTVFAAAPTGVNTQQTNKVIDIVVWIGIVAIGAAGAIPSLIKLVEGQTNEDVRGRNSGIAGLAVTAAVVGAIYAVKAIFFS